MSEELACVLINPYTIVKSRTGGVIARLLARSEHDLVAVRMFSPSKELANEYATIIREETEEDDLAIDENKKSIRELIAEYVLNNYAPDPVTGRRRRVMMFLFRGHDAIRKLRDEVAGHITYSTVAGETIRDTYGDYIVEKNGNVSYFEPAVLVLPSGNSAEKTLKIWTKYSDENGGILENVVYYAGGIVPEKTVVLIKPENFDRPTYRVGNMIDMFSKTGLFIIGSRIVRMSIDQALEFYGPVKEELLKKMKSQVASKVDAALSGCFDFPVAPDLLNGLAEKLTPNYVEREFNKIIEFMTGLNPSDVTDPEERKKPGRQRCLALIYEGKDAVQKIRNVLGLTDPEKAAPATIRREYGRSIMINAAHASDSPENAEREMSILDIGKNDVRKVVEDFFNNKKG